MVTNLAPETPPSRGISSRLLTMKFMQRAATSGSPAEPSPEEPSSKRRKFQNSPLTGDFHSFDQSAVQAALQAQEAKRLSALEASRGDLADSHWVLDGQWGSGSDKKADAAPSVVYVGYADIDGGSGDDDDEEGLQQVGRKKIGNYGQNKDVKKVAVEEDSDSSSSSSNDEDDSDDEEDSDDEVDTPVSRPKAKKKVVEGLASGGHGRTRVNLQPKKAVESQKAREFRDKRMKKEVKLNKLSSISGGFTSPAANNSHMANLNCHNCGKVGHKALDCPNKQKGGKRKSFGKSRQTIGEICDGGPPWAEDDNKKSERANKRLTRGVCFGLAW
ncbi:hypothetical protein Cob_v008687 [Colletotrichum orbiculare MAFF 240422]|uniref:CCHC-type domain-containing protein n=1 Tax=Colletotrichum orbiculare (strain 104-T / ATCC 96160 / CBS 514.97 / LARS 414 / MAFF 240422) TaxID=1213857 RepID=A0A484FKV6_COLOR|nr:hypothetical protein Cob_v008687 [Colletotrichum orbiculare MAFF 240422]